MISSSIQNMKAVIVAGGKGTRLGSIADEIPKPMVPLNGMPLLEHQVRWLKAEGISEIWMIINHLGQVIRQHFGDGSKLGVQIQYYEESTPLGTVGGIKAIENELNSDFLVLYGDVVISMDLQRLLQFHQQKSSDATLVVHPNDHPYDSDLLSLDSEDRVTAFHPKPHPEGFFYRNMVNAAVYIFSPKVLKYLEKDKKADFGKDIFPAIIHQLRFFGYNTTEYIKDMGTPDRLEKVSADLSSGKVQRRHLRFPQKAIFLDRDGVINPDKGLICRPDDFELFPETASAIQKINRSDYIAIIVTNQPGIAKGMYDFDTLDDIHKKMDTLLGQERAKIDALYFCPHHPEKGFEGERPEFKIQCRCRKPEPGMLQDAAERFHIDLASSYIIGDHQRDILAGKSVGCTTIGVRTGHALQGTTVQPDFMADNILDAVNLILSLSS